MDEEPIQQEQPAEPVKEIILQTTSTRKWLMIGSLGFLVIIIILLLIFNIPNRRPHDPARISDFSELQIALDFYFEKNNSYPFGNFQAMGKALVDEGFFEAIPDDSINKGNQKIYEYATNLNGKDYVLRVELENEKSAFLANDLDEIILSFNCDDPYFCIGS